LLDQAIEMTRVRLPILPEANVRLASLLRKKGLEAYRASDLELGEGCPSRSGVPPIPAAVLTGPRGGLEAAGKKMKPIQVLRKWPSAAEGAVEPSAPLLRLLLLECGHSPSPLEPLPVLLSSGAPASASAESFELRALASQGHDE